VTYISVIESRYLLTSKPKYFARSPCFIFMKMLVTSVSYFTRNYLNKVTPWSFLSSGNCFYVTLQFIALFTRSHSLYLYPSRLNLIQIFVPYLFRINFNIIVLYIFWCLNLYSPMIILYAFLIYRMRATNFHEGTLLEGETFNRVNVLVTQACTAMLAVYIYIRRWTETDVYIWLVKGFLRISL
jgi:hypothetical protein